MVRTIAVNIKGDRSRCTFHKSMKAIVVLANCIGLLPVNGVTSNFAENLKFKWLSPKTFFSFTILLAAATRLASEAFALHHLGFSLFKSSKVNRYRKYNI